MYIKYRYSNNYECLQKYKKNYNYSYMNIRYNQYYTCEYLFKKESYQVQTLNLILFDTDLYIYP